MMKRSKHNLIQSIHFALQGIVYALRRERNLRIHLSVAGWVIYFSRYYAFSAEQTALLFLVIGLVITCELFNTAIEKTVDLEKPAYNPLAKVAKDVAAGAVLVSSITSVAVGILLFGDPAVIARIWADIIGHLALFGFAAALSGWWIFGVPDSQNKNNKNNKE